MSDSRFMREEAAQSDARMASRPSPGWAKTSGTAVVALGISLVGWGAYVGLAPSALLPLDAAAMAPETMALCLFALGTALALIGALRIYRAFED